MLKDVTVVIPVYNTAKYLPDCIESLIHQTLKNVEFIFVDDGSTDCSVEIIEEYKRKDCRIQLIKQENLYAGVARNTGMRIATGKYIIFLDSDDFFELTMLEDAFKCAEINHAEITVFGYSCYSNIDYTVRDVSFPRFPQKIFSIDDMGGDFFRSFNAAPWNKLYLKKFIEESNLYFQAIPKCNDAFFTYMSAFFAKRIKFLKKRLVYYRINNNDSLQGNFNKNRDAIIDCELAIRTKLLETGLYYGVRKSAYLANAKEMICAYSSVKNAEIECLRQYYYRVRDSLIPGLFDGETDFEDNPLIMQFYSGSFESFLLYQSCETLKQLQALRTEVNAKKSIDYRIGHYLLIVPRNIIHFVKRFPNTKHPE